MTAPPADRGDAAPDTGFSERASAVPEAAFAEPANADYSAAPPEAGAGTRPPVLATPTWYLGVVVVAWAAYFASLVTVYLIAFTKHNSAAESAAGWGMSASLAAALLTLPLAARGRRPDPPAEVSPGTALAVGGLLAAASVAVIWVAVNLTLANHTAGPWSLTVIATVAPATSLLGRLTSPLDPQAREATVTPDTVQSAIRPPDSLLTAPAVLMAPAVLAPPTPPGAAETTAESAHTMAAQPADLATLEDVRDQGSTSAVTPPDTLLLPRPLRVGGLLHPDWQRRLGKRPPKVAVDAGFWDELTSALGRRTTEVGGVALTLPSAGTLLILGAVFPDQLKANGGYCEFSVADVERVRDVIDTVADDIGADAENLAVTWVHTHPGMHIFLSGIDTDTAAQWRALNPDFTPIVLNPLATVLPEQIGVFDARNRPITPLEVVPGLVNGEAAALLKDKLLSAYNTEGMGQTMVFIRGVDR